MSTGTTGTTTQRMSGPRRRSPRGSGEQLRAEIIGATKELLAKAGNADAVSIRAVAQAVGVTSPSIYLHFADKDALLDAVVIDVFAELDVAMVAAAEGVGHPLERLFAYGLAYVRFAVGHPEHYRIATMVPLATPAERVDEVLRAAAFDHMLEAVGGCMQAGIFADGDPLPITLDLWASAHGIASLMITKPYLPWGGVEAAATRVLCTAAMGHATSGLFGPDVPAPADFATWLAAVQQ